MSDRQVLLSLSAQEASLLLSLRRRSLAAPRGRRFRRYYSYPPLEDVLAEDECVTAPDFEIYCSEMQLEDDRVFNGLRANGKLTTNEPCYTHGEKVKTVGKRYRRDLLPHQCKECLPLGMGLPKRLSTAGFAQAFNLVELSWTSYTDAGVHMSLYYLKQRVAAGALGSVMYYGRSMLVPQDVLDADIKHLLSIDRDGYWMYH